MVPPSTPRAHLFPPRPSPSQIPAPTNPASTDDSGNYVVPLLPVGRYSVSVEKEGFNPFVNSDVTLQVNTTVQVNATLDVKGTAEQVSVTGTAIMVQTTATNPVQVVDERRIVDLPLNGRNVLQLMTLSAGVSDRGAHYVLARLYQKTGDTERAHSEFEKHKNVMERDRNMQYRRLLISIRDERGSERP